MIKIISTLLEKNTDEVIDFLLASNADFSRINYEDFHPYSFFLTSGYKQNSKVVHWHRRGRINFNPKVVYPGYRFLRNDSRHRNNVRSISIALDRITLTSRQQPPCHSVGISEH